MTDTLRVLPEPPPRPAMAAGLTFTSGWTDTNAGAVYAILADHDPLGEGDTGLRDVPDDARLVVVAWTDGEPVAFLAGRKLAGGLALCSFFRGLQQWHGKYRVGLALWSQWLALMREHAIRTVVIGIDQADPPDYRRRVERFARLAGFVPYAEDPRTTWHRLEVA
jgi:hypothetical protein